MSHAIPAGPDPAKVMEYAEGFVPPRPPVVARMEQRAQEEKFPIIGPACGWFCYTVARMINARRIFEMGSGFGYSTYWFARAVSEAGGGEVHHTVWDQDLSEQARAAMDELGFSGIVKYHVSEAIEALSAAEGLFDVVFCDIDKHAYPEAFAVAKNKLRPGGVIIFDNMIWDGRIFDPEDRKDSTEGIRKTAEMFRADPGFAASIIPLRDGLMMAWKKI